MCVCVCVCVLHVRLPIWPPLKAPKSRALPSSHFLLQRSLITNVSSRYNAEERERGEGLTMENKKKMKVKKGKRGLEHLRERNKEDKTKTWRANCSSSVQEKESRQSSRELFVVLYNTCLLAIAIKGSFGFHFQTVSGIVILTIILVISSLFICSPMEPLLSFGLNDFFCVNEATIGTRPSVISLKEMQAMYIS